MFIKPIKDISTLQDYLVSNERYCGPFYRVPNSLLVGEWLKFDKYIQANHPIQYFFRDTIVNKFHLVRNNIGRVYWYLKHWIREDNKVKLGPPAYYDSDSRIELCLEKIFMDFYNIEFLQGYVNWDAEPAIKAEILEIHKYFTQEKLERDKKLEDSDNELYGDWEKSLNNGNPEHFTKFQVGWDIEDDNNKRHDEILMRVVKLRRSLWT